MSSTNRKIARISALLIGISVVGNGLSLVKEMLVARAFGISGAMDAFYAALAVPALISNLMMSVLTSIFIPMYVKVAPGERDRVASAVMNWILLVALGLIVPLELFAPLVVKLFFHGLSPETSALAVSFLRQLNFTILITVLISLFTGILNARENFALPAASTMCVTLCIMGLVIYFPQKVGIHALSLGMIGGLLLQTLLLWRELRREGFAYAPTLDIEARGAGGVMSSAMVFFAAALIAQLSPLFSQMLASWLPEGSISTLGYAGKLLQVPMVIFTGAITTAVLPYFSMQISGGKLDELCFSLERSLRMTAYVLIPVSMLTVVFSRPAIRILFQHGRFDEAATSMISVAFIFFAAQLFFNTAGMIIGRVFFAMRELWVFVKLSALLVPVNLLFSILLPRFMNPPVVGLTLATSLGYLFGTVSLYVVLRRRLPALSTGYILDGIWKAVCSGLFATAAAWIALAELSLRLHSYMLAVALSACVAVAAIIIASHLLRVDEYKSLVKIAGEKISRFLKA